jgi:hypothetical protein
LNQHEFQQKRLCFFDKKNGVMQGDWGFSVTNMTMIFLANTYWGFAEQV